MDEKRRNEIAWMILVEKTKKAGLPSFNANDFKRNLGNHAKALEISFDEAGDFARALLEPLFKELINQTIKSDGHNFRDGVEG